MSASHRVALALSIFAFSSAASAADLATRAPVYTKAPVYAPVSNWTGLYIGGNVGYGWGNNDTNFNFVPSEDVFSDRNGTITNNTKGIIGGGQIGYNWQVGTFVTGLEADFQGADVRGSSTGRIFNIVLNNLEAPTVLRSSDQSLSWFGTLRGRLGATITPNVMLYGTGGLAYGEVKDSATTFFNAVSQFPASVSQVKAGWTAGAGVEWMFARGWSAKVEYLHVDLGNISVKAQSTVPGDIIAGNFVANTFHNQFDTVRFGVNYHFN